METLLINPREAFVALQASGISDEQANAIVKIFEDINVDQLATKTDIEHLRIDIEHLRQEVKADVEIAIEKITNKIYIVAFAVVGVLSAIKYFG